MAVPTSLIDKLTNYGLLVAGGFGLYFIGKRMNEKAKHDNVESNLGTDPNAQAAQQLRAAFNPSGQGFLMWGDGTTTDVVMAVGAKIKDFGKVATAYNALYKSSLADDLTQELSSTELTTFYKLIAGKPKAVAKGNGIGLGDEIMSNPRPGFKKIGYYGDPTGQTSIKILYWHEKPKAYCGVVVKMLKKAVKDSQGKTVMKLMYGVNKIPMANFDKSRILWVFAEEVTKLKK